MNLTIGKKLSISAIVNLSLLIILSIVAYLSLLQIRNTSDEVVSLVPKVAKMDQLQFSLAEALKINDFLVSSDLEKKDSFELSVLAMGELMESLEKLELTMEEKNVLTKVKKEFSLLREKTRQIFKMVTVSGGSFVSQSVNTLINDVDAIGILLVGDSEFLHEQSHKELDAAMQKVEHVKRSNTRITGAVSIAGIIIAIIGSFVLARNITKPIQALTSTAKTITEGNFDKRVNITSQDEIGQLANAFNYMTANLKDFYTNLEEKVAKRTKDLSRSNMKLQKEMIERKQTEREIQKQNKFLNSVLESLTHPFYVIDANDYTIKMANSAANFGALSERSTCYKITHHQDEPCNGADNPCPLQEVKKTKKPVIAEHIHYDKNGNPRNVEIHAYPLFDDKGNVSEMIEYSFDITNRKQAEQATVHLNEQLKKTNNELRNFVYIASHDLREPVRKIMSFGLLLKQSFSAKITDNDKENLDFMIEGASRITKMVEGLLVYSCVSTKNQIPETVNVDEIIDQLKKFELAVLFKEKNITVNIPQPLLSIKADRVQIRQLLQGLIVNGVKYQKPEVAPVITITSTHAADGMVKIEVKDNGIGIKPEYQQIIFNMFKRLHSHSKYEGMGTGLTVCKKIVELHNGDIGVESDYGKGSIFWFTLPAAEVSSEAVLQS